MSSIDEKIMQVEDLLLHAAEYRTGIRLLLVSDSQFLLVDDGYLNRYTQIREMEIIRGLTFSREKILDVFIKLEVMLTELIKLKLVGFYSERAVMLEEIIKNMNIHRKREILKTWGIIDRPLSSRLETLKNQK